jgi:hypothetical protein
MPPKLDPNAIVERKFSQFAPPPANLPMVANLFFFWNISHRPRDRW